MAVRAQSKILLSEEVLTVIQSILTHDFPWVFLQNMTFNRRRIGKPRIWDELAVPARLKAWQGFSPLAFSLGTIQ
jgi:hypothetical protein